MEEKLIQVDANWLGDYSQRLNMIITANQADKKYMQDPEKLMANLKCQGAIEIINEILEKYNK